MANIGKRMEERGFRDADILFLELFTKHSLQLWNTVKYVLFYRILIFQSKHLKELKCISFLCIFRNFWCTEDFLQCIFHIFVPEAIDQRIKEWCCHAVKQGHKFLCPRMAPGAWTHIHHHNWAIEQGNHQEMGGTRRQSFVPAWASWDPKYSSQN